MRHIFAIAGLSLALAALSACGELDGFSDYGGGRGNYGYRSGPPAFWGQGYAPQPQYGYRGGGDHGRGGPGWGGPGWGGGQGWGGPGRDGPGRDGGSAFRAAPPVARAAPAQVPRGVPMSGSGGRGTGGGAGPRVEQGAD